MRESVRSETRAAYREAILEAAERVFGRVGFQRAKMTDIASEAGVAAGTLYNYFKNKEQVFESILERGANELLLRVQALPEVDDPLARMRAFLQGTFEFLEEHGGLFSIFISRGGAHEWGRQKIHRDSTHQELYDGFEKLALATLREAVERGQLRRDVALVELNEMLNGLVDAVLFMWFRQGCPPTLTQKLDLLFDMFLNGAHAR